MDPYRPIALKIQAEIPVGSSASGAANLRALEILEWEYEKQDDSVRML